MLKFLSVLWLYIRIMYLISPSREIVVYSTALIGIISYICIISIFVVTFCIIASVKRCKRASQVEDPIEIICTDTSYKSSSRLRHDDIDNIPVFNTATLPTTTLPTSSPITTTIPIVSISFMDELHANLLAR